MTPAQTVIQEVLGVKKNETVLIVANPQTYNIAHDLYVASNESGAKTTLMFQETKTLMDNAEDAVIGAIKSEPDVILSISENKLGKDAAAAKEPYVVDGKTFNSTFDYLMEGKKCTRAVWTPGITQDMFNRTVQIDYRQLADRCEKICRKYKNAVSIHVTSPNGTDVLVPVAGRQGLVDDGDFTKPGSGGNVPAGEVFISPVVGRGNTQTVEAVEKGIKAIKSVKELFGRKSDTLPEEAEERNTEAAESTDINSLGTNGTIVFDGSMSFNGGDALLETPITVVVKDGFVSDISGGEEAKRLQKDITEAEARSLLMERNGNLPEGQGLVYARNARNIGELGIGLNPAAQITGNMLEDEKAFRTCHFAIGQNYDGDAPALIHFDGVVRYPTITVNYADGTEYVLLDKGELTL